MIEINDSFNTTGDSLMRIGHIKAIKIYNEYEFPVVNKDLVGRPPFDGIWRGDYDEGDMTEEEIAQQSANNKWIEDNILTNPEITITEGTVSEINIPGEIQGTPKITATLAPGTTLKTEAKKPIYLTHTGEFPVSVMIDAPNSGTVYLDGNFGQVTTNSNITLKNGSVGNVVLEAELTHEISITAPLGGDSIISSPVSDKAITIMNSNPFASLTVSAPNATVTLGGPEYSTVTSTTGDNTLVIGQATKVGLLRVMKGNVIVIDTTVDGHILEIENKTEYTVGPNIVEVPADTKSLTGKPGIYQITGEGVQTNAVFGIGATGNYIFENNGSVVSNNKNGVCLTRSGVNVEFKGTGSWENPSGYGIWKASETGSLKIYGGHFKAKTHVVYAESGVIEIYGGEFELEGTDDKTYLLNCYDANYTSGKANIKVCGGKFYDFDPAQSTSEPGGPVSFLADGYLTDARRIGDNVVYSVLPKTNSEVVAKIKAGGNVTLSEDLVVLERKSLTMTKDIVLNLGGHSIDSWGGTRGDTIEIQKATVTIKDGVVPPPVNYIDNGATIAVMGSSNVTLENLMVTGERCVLNSASNNQITIKSGTYTSPNNAPAVYYSAGSNSKITIEGGTFKSNPDPGKTNYTINIKDDLVPSGTDPRQFIEIKGGKFIGFNPAQSEAEPGKPVSLVADGYKSTEIEPGVWEVTKE